MTLRRFLLALLVAGLVTLAARADSVLILDDEFIETYKHRATIPIQFSVVFSHDHPNAAVKDGDIHVAGVSPEIRLPMVAEMMNAKMKLPLVHLFNAREGQPKGEPGPPFPITGVWRIWPEHGGDMVFRQGQPEGAYPHTNPDHVFEIHPVTSVNGQQVLDTFRVIPGYTPKEAAKAFHDFENGFCRLDHDAAAHRTSIRMRQVGNNYVRFRLRFREDPTVQTSNADGITALCSVHDLDDELKVTERRMVFVRDTRPYKVAITKKTGDSMEVLGMPRVNLSLVAWRIRHAFAERPQSFPAPGFPTEEDYNQRAEVLEWSLPYEMVIVGVYP